MITIYKKIGRFLTVCPVVLLSRGCRQKIWSMLCWLYAWLSDNQAVQIGIVMLAVLILVLYKKSVSLYTYDRNGEPVYLGRLPVWQRGEDFVYLPDFLLQKSGTGRFYLEFDMKSEKKQRNRKIIIQTGKHKKVCRAGRAIRIVAIGN